MADVRSLEGTPTASDFQYSKTGTPIIVDVTAGAVAAYVLDAAGAVQPLSTGGSGGAPTNATYVTLSTNATLTNERVLTAGANISLTDNGPGNTLVIAASGGGGSVASGTAELDFGGSPTAETDVTSVTVADAGVGAASEIIVSLRYAATADHSADETLITPINLCVGNISPGIGFDIHGYCSDQAWGKFPVAWVRN